MKFVKSLLLLAISVVAIMGLSTLVSAKTYPTVKPVVNNANGVNVSVSVNKNDITHDSYAGFIVPVELTTDGYLDVTGTYSSDSDKEEYCFYRRNNLESVIYGVTKTLDFSETVLNKKIKLAKGTYYIGCENWVGASSSYVQKINFNIKFYGKEETRPLKVGYNKYISDANNVMLKYTATKTGVTTFKMPGEYGYNYTIANAAKKAISDEGWTSGNVSNFTFNFVAKKGTTYYIKIKAIDTDVIDRNITISEKAIKNTTGKSRKKAKKLKKKKKVTGFVAAGDNNTCWFKFKQKKTGVCPLVFSGATLGKLEVTVYYGKHRVGSVSYTGGKHQLKVTYGTTFGKAKKGTYYVKITRGDALSCGNFTVKYK